MLKRFRNSSEDRIQKQIREVIGRHGAELHEKVRVADIVDIDKLDRRGTKILKMREEIMKLTIRKRRLQYQAAAA